MRGRWPNSPKLSEHSATATPPGIITDKRLKPIPTTIGAEAHLAQMEHELGNEAAATELYEHVLENDANAIWALVELAQVITERDPERSAELCNRALEIDPAYPWPWPNAACLRA